MLDWDTDPHFGIRPTLWSPILFEKGCMEDRTTVETTDPVEDAPSIIFGVRCIYECCWMHP
jgi:hypothetical protein